MYLMGDFHTHTPYSHGKNTVLQNAMAAKERGLKTIAITDHGFNHLLFGLSRKKLNNLKEEIKEAEKLTGVKVLMGMESNLISLDGSTDMKSEDLHNFDIYLCGIHSVLKYKSFSDFNNIMLKNYIAYKFGKKPSVSVVQNTTKAYINAIKNNPIDILTHINFKCFCDVKEVAKCCADYGTYIEINTKKRHISAEELNLMASVGTHFVINSDAHSADRVGDTVIAEELIKEAELPLNLIDNINGRLPVFRFEIYKEKYL
ncbi:MAG: PHP domain-containing protein [Clostridiales bacterium]|nr:PHP domain-containing protein [Clostridiales bacterium]